MKTIEKIILTIIFFIPIVAFCAFVGIFIQPLLTIEEVVWENHEGEN